MKAKLRLHQQVEIRQKNQETMPKNRPRQIAPFPYLQLWPLGLSVILLLVLTQTVLAALPDNAAEKGPLQAVEKPLEKKLEKDCLDRLRKIPFAGKTSHIEVICQHVEQLPSCQSVQGAALFHFDKKGHGGLKILTFALIHGDEEAAASVALAWMSRLTAIDSRNTWRVIPVLNPDGWALKTRTNSHGIDLNRNFPTRDWAALAQKDWVAKESSNPRRFPGDAAASEPETRCAMAHVEEFKPDLIISIHTPLAVLDFDGPKIKAPPAAPLRWVSLGNFPGSLGRYAWVERKLPVLTVELKKSSDAQLGFDEFERLQDLSGTAAIEAERALQKKRTSGAKKKATAEISQNL